MSLRGVAMFSSRKSIEISKILFLTLVLGLLSCTKKSVQQQNTKVLDVTPLNVIKAMEISANTALASAVVEVKKEEKLEAKKPVVKLVIKTIPKVTPKAVLKVAKERAPKVASKIITQKVSQKISATKELKTTTNENASVSKTIANKERPLVTPSITFASTVNSSLHQMDDPRRVVVNTTSIGVKFRLRNGVSISTKLAMGKKLTGMRNQSLKDSYISVSKNLLKISESLNLSGSAVVLMPISEYSREVSMLQTGYSLSPTLSLDLSKAGLKGFGLSYSPSFSQKFHRMEVSAGGSSNTQFSFGHSAGLSYSPAEKWSLGIDGSYAKSYTYQGNESDSYSIDQYVSYAPIKNLGLSLSHSRGGNVLAANGKDYDIELFNADNSSVAFGLNYTYK